MTLLIQRLHLKSAFLLLACLVVPATLLARHSASSLLILMAATAVIFKFQNKDEFKFYWTPSCFAFFLLALWMGCSCFWNPSVSEGLASLFRFIVITLAGFTALGFTHTLRQKDTLFVHKALPAGITTGLALMGLILLNEQFFHFNTLKTIFKGSGLNHATSLLAILMWPCALALYIQKRPSTAGLFICTCVGVIISLENETAKIAALLALFVGSASFFAPRRWVRSFKMLIPLFMVTAPLLPKIILAPENLNPLFKEWQVKSSLTHRLYIWSATSDRIAVHPIRGWGINASRIQYHGVLQQKKDRVKGLDFKNLSPKVIGLALHPHNAALQLWLDLGIPGVALAIFIIWRLLQTLEAVKGRLSQQASLAALTAALTISNSSYGLWQTWWMASLWIATILLSTVIFERTGA